MSQARSRRTRKTVLGRVVYDRKLHIFTARDALRIAAKLKSIEIPEKDYEIFIQRFIQFVMLMLQAISAYERDQAIKTLLGEALMQIIQEALKTLKELGGDFFDRLRQFVISIFEFVFRK